AALDARGRPVADAQDLGNVGAAFQRLAFGPRHQPGDDAADLGRPDIEYGVERGAAGLHGPEARGHGIGDHGLVFLLSSSRCADLRATRPGTRRSMSVMSRSSRA